MSGYIGTKAVTLSTTAATVSGSSTVGAGLTVDNDGATVLTVDRATSNGTLVDFQKDGSAVGSLGVNGDRIYLTNAQEGIMIDQSANNLSPTSSTGTFNDNAMNLGESGNRWKDLYLSGGVYLGGTGSANKLEDYEEGSWSPASSQCTLSLNSRVYRKIGDFVYLQAYLGISSTTASPLIITGLPFTPASNSWSPSILNCGASNANDIFMVRLNPNGSIDVKKGNDTAVNANEVGAFMTFHIVYHV